MLGSRFCSGTLEQNISLEGRPNKPSFIILTRNYPENFKLNPWGREGAPGLASVLVVGYTPGLVLVWDIQTSVSTMVSQQPRHVAEVTSSGIQTLVYIDWKHAKSQ